MHICGYMYIKYVNTVLRTVFSNTKRQTYNISLLKLFLAGFQDKQLAWNLLLQIYFPNLHTNTSFQQLTQFGCLQLPDKASTLECWAPVCHTYKASCFWCVYHPPFSIVCEQKWLCLEKLKSRNEHHCQLAEIDNKMCVWKYFVLLWHIGSQLHTLSPIL